VVGRAELISAVLFLAALHCYLPAKPHQLHERPLNLSSRTAVCLFLAVLAMLAKETGITVLGVCAAHDVWMVDWPRVCAAPHSTDSRCTLRRLGRRLVRDLPVHLRPPASAIQ
jgi:hypothetical protein